MRRRLEALGVPGGEAPAQTPEVVARLSALHAHAGGDHRSREALEAEARRELAALRERGWDLGLTDAARAEGRVDAIYEHARAALYAVVDDAVIRDAAARPLLVRTAAATRDEYLSAPPAGERLRDEDAGAVESLYPLRRPQVQLVVSDLEPREGCRARHGNNDRREQGQLLLRRAGLRQGLLPEPGGVSRGAAVGGFLIASRGPVATYCTSRGGAVFCLKSRGVGGEMAGSFVPRIRRREGTRR
jgi:hypothetical protein